MRPEPSLWRALADPTRRRLVELLRDGPRTTGELCRAFPTSRFAVMKHLRVLERGGLIGVGRDGRKRWNSLNHERLHQVAGWWGGSGPAAPAAVDAASAQGGGQTVPANDSAPVGPTGAGPVTRLVFVDAVPWKVFDALTVNIAGWWGAPYLRSADASNLVLEAHPGGRFYEEWGHRQGAWRGTVTAIRQDERLELSGPVFDGAGDCRLAFVLDAREGGTLVTVTCERVPPEAVQDLFHDRLKAFVERGVHSGIAR